MPSVSRVWRGSHLSGCSIEGWMSATRTVSPGSGSAIRTVPNTSVATRSAAAAPVPSSAGRQRSTTQPARAAFTASSTNDTAWTPASSAIWITRRCRYCE